jgi:hypothetical protein
VDRVFVEWHDKARPGWGGYISSLDQDFVAGFNSMVAEFGRPTKVEFRAADEGWIHGTVIEDDRKALGLTEAGDECPLCECGTVEIVGEVVGKTAPKDVVINRETRCRGECGSVAPTHPSIPAGPGCTVGRNETKA